MDRKIFLATLVCLVIMMAFYAILYLKTMPIIDQATAMVDDVQKVVNSFGIKPKDK